MLNPQSLIIKSSFSPHFPTAPSGPGPPHYKDFMITLRHITLGRTPLDEWSARRRGLYLTTHNTHERHAPGGNWTRNPNMRAAADPRLKVAIHCQINWANFYVWSHTWWKNWVNRAVLTGNSAGLASKLPFPVVFRTENCAVHSGNLTVSSVYLPDTTMASSQGTSVSSNSFSRSASHDIFLFKYHFLLHILRFLFFFSDNITADVASKQQTTAFFFLSTTVTRTKRHTELTPPKKLINLMENLCCAREHSVLFFVQFFFYTVKLHSLT